jgi:hypothetical protein
MRRSIWRFERSSLSRRSRFRRFRARMLQAEMSIGCFSARPHWNRSASSHRRGVRSSISAWARQQGSRSRTWDKTKPRSDLLSRASEDCLLAVFAPFLRWPSMVRSAWWMRGYMRMIRVTSVGTRCRTRHGCWAFHPESECGFGSDLMPGSLEPGGREAGLRPQAELVEGLPPLDAARRQLLDAGMARTFGSTHVQTAAIKLFAAGRRGQSTHRYSSSGLGSTAATASPEPCHERLR